jgi:Domain of unknown function (DUF4303)
MKEFNFEQFKFKLKQSTKKNFLQLKEENKDICAFGLYSDESAMSISISYNTAIHLNELQDEDPDEKTYYKWSPGEWICESDVIGDFEELNEELKPSAEERFSNDDEFLEFRDSLFNTAVEVLSELKSEGVFDGNDDNFVLLFSASEYENIEKEIKWVKQLNFEKSAKQFEDWLIEDSK